jgi:hypothetical protein
MVSLLDLLQVRKLKEFNIYLFLLLDQTRTIYQRKLLEALTNEKTEGKSY